MAQSISNLPVGSLIIDPSSTFLGANLIWKIADQNHAGYPSNSTTLITDKIIAMRPFDATEPNNADSDRQAAGNNRYSVSNIRQWLNSDAEAGAWYIAQHDTDQSPTESYVGGPGWNDYANDAGFLNGFSDNFKNILLDTTLTVALNTVTDGGGSETVTDKIFLASNTEVGLANENSIVEGSILSIFSDDASRIASTTAECIIDDEYPYDTSATWWLRTPEVEYSYRCRPINTSGSHLSTAVYWGNHGVRPLCNISNTIEVSDTPDENGYYVLFPEQYFMITWCNYDNTILQTSYAKKDTIPVYSKGTPTRKEDQEYWYTFNKWIPDLVPATQDATYTATYSTEPSYTCTFYAQDGKTILQTNILHYNDIIPMAPTAPTIAGYNFIEYSGYTEGINITQDIDFIAQYEIIPGLLNAEGAAHLLKSIKFQYQNIPQPSAAFENKIIQPTRNISIRYDNSPTKYYCGYSYICLKDDVNNNYYWKEIKELENIFDGSNKGIESEVSSSSGLYSIAFGSNCKAKGDYSVALGIKSQANGIASFAMGDWTVANGDYSVALGLDSEAYGVASFAMGDYSVADGDYSMAVGNNCKAYGIYSVALGNKSKANGSYSFSMGNNCSTESSGSVSLGRNCSADGVCSITMGNGCVTDGSAAIAMGRNTYSSGGYGSTALGYKSNATNDSALAAGEKANADGYSSMALGYSVGTGVEGSCIVGQFGYLDVSSYPNTVFAVASGTEDDHIGMHFSGLDGDGVLYIENKPAVTSTQGLTKIWAGTQTEYDAITTKDSTTLYIII